MVSYTLVENQGARAEGSSHHWKWDIVKAKHSKDVVHYFWYFVSKESIDGLTLVLCSKILQQNRSKRIYLHLAPNYVPNA